MNVWKMLQGKYMKALMIVYMHVQLCDKSISHLRRHAKLNGTKFGEYNSIYYEVIVSQTSTNCNRLA
jgi:hypothetical protein